jgi:hypothetical protein
MKNIQFESHTGAFAYTVTTVIGDEVNAETMNLAICGLADVSFRGTASAVDKALRKVGAIPEKTIDALTGKERKGKRSDAPYTPENAALVEKTAQGALDEMALDEEHPIPQITFKVTGEYVGGDQVQSRKMATEMWAKVVGTPMEGALKTFGLPDDASDEQGVEACHKFLASCRATPVRKEKK